MKSLLCAFALTLSASLYGQILTMKIENPQVYGNQVTYDVSVEDFTNIISMQYSISYDTTKMSLSSIQNFHIETMNHGNFNDYGPGILLNIWFDPAVEPLTLSDGTVIYQLVFDMINNTYGNVCFVEDPLEIEFGGGDDFNVLTFIIEDDCHSEPFPITLNSTGTIDVFAIMGLMVHPIALDQKINFTLDTEQVLEFELYTLHGSNVERFEKTLYAKGSNQLEINTSIANGIYMLSVRSANETRAYKIASQ